MKKVFMTALSAIALTGFTTASLMPEALAVATAPLVSSSGVLNDGQDHFVEVAVDGFALDRIKIVCITFHELSEAVIEGTDIPYNIAYGFEEFSITFEEPIPVGETVRIQMKDSRVRGRYDGLVVPYRVFGYSETLGEIPLGTAVVTIPEVTGR